MDTLTIIITGGILLIAIIVAVILANRTSWRSSSIKQDNPIEHYTKMRDELTISGTEPTTTSGSGMFMDISVAAIGIGVVVMVGYLVISNVKAAMPDAINATTSSTATSSVVFSGFALVSVGIIVLAAFGLLSIFRD